MSPEGVNKHFTSITISLILQHVDMTFIPKLSTTSTLHTPSFFNGLITSFNIISPTCVFNDILKVLLCRTVCVFICNLCCCCCCCYCCCCCCRVIMNRLIAVFYLLVTVLNLLRYMISTWYLFQCSARWDSWRYSRISPLLRLITRLLLYQNRLQNWLVGKYTRLLTSLSR